MDYLQPLLPKTEANARLEDNVHPRDWQNPIPEGRYNLVVIGAGTAGLVAAAGAAGMGAKVALIERALMGGDCLNVGCVPSKALLSAARYAAAARQATEFGVQVDGTRVDFAQVMERMRHLRARISPNDSAERFQRLGVDVFFGHARFNGRNSITVEGQELVFAKALIATGARAAVPSLPGIQDIEVLTNENLFSLTELPKRLVVIGGGPIGCEMAQAFANFGSEVTLVEKSGQILSREEEDAAAIVAKSMQRHGVQILLNASVEKIEKGDQQTKVTVTQAGNAMEVIADQVLSGIGRAPNVSDMGLELAGIDFDTRSGISVDDTLRTSNRNVFAAGDVCSSYKFTHAADFLARTVVRNALFLGRQKASSLIVPWCTYTSPEIAHVGIYPEEAQHRGMAIRTFTQEWSEVDRTILAGEEDGFVRVHCQAGTDRIVGATVVGEYAGDLIGEIVLAMQQRIGLGKIASVIHPYPTRAEAFRKIGDQYNRTRLTKRVQKLAGAWLRWNR